MPSARDQDVARLEVAVNHQALMRVLHGGADRSKQFETFGNRQSTGIAVLVDGCAVDQFHDQIGHSIVGGATIEQAGDVGMVETGQDLALVAEALQDELVVEAATHQLDGNLMLELAIDADGAVDLSHAAAADFLKDVVGADPAADTRGRRRRAQVGQRSDGGIAQETALRQQVGAQQRFDFGPEVGIDGKDLVEVGAALDRVETQGVIEHFLYLLPLFPFHAGALREISRWSQIRAVVHSRETVAGDMPSTSEVSSIERPAKKRSSTMRLCCSSSFARSCKASSSTTTSRSACLGRSDPSSKVTLQAFPPRFAAW